MKKTLLSLGLLLIAYCANAQVLLSEDVSSLSVGNVGTDLTGTVPGQGGWLTKVVAGGSNSDFQVVNYGGEYGNVFQINGSSTVENTRRLFKNVSSDWGFRDDGTNVAEVQFDFFTGPATTSANSMRVLLYNQDLTKMIGGIMVNMSTLVLSGLSYYDNTAATGGILGNYSFRLSYTATPAPAYSDLILQRNTWYRLGFSFNYTTGEVIFKESTGLISSPPIMGASAGTEIAEANMIMTAISATGQVNTTSASGLYDNFIFKTSTTNTPLAVINQNSGDQFSVFPNPAVNIINVTSGNVNLIQKIMLTDINGRIVKKVDYDQINSVTVDIADLQPGIYLMEIRSSQGLVIKKIMKN